VDDPLVQVLTMMGRRGGRALWPGASTVAQAWARADGCPAEHGPRMRALDRWVAERHFPGGASLAAELFNDPAAAAARLRAHLAVDMLGGRPWDGR
jgi:hypothetical protein